MTDFTEQQISDARYWAEAGLATGRNDSCQRCPRKYGEPSPDCPNRAEHAQVPQFGSAKGKVEMTPDFDAEMSLEPVKPEVSYRIEKRSDTGQPTEYWSEDGMTPRCGYWMRWQYDATTYTEAERVEFLNRTLRSEPSGFPEGGCWCRVEAREQEGKVSA